MRWKWIVGSAVCLLIALTVSVYVFLERYDYNQLKPQIARIVKDATGRELNLGGDVDIEIGLSPTLVVKAVTFANAAWGSRPQMIQAAQLQVALRLLPLLSGDVVLRYVGLVGVDVFLETDPDGKGNWAFKADRGSGKGPAGAKAWGIDIDRLSIQNLRLTYRQGATGATTHYAIDRLDLARQNAADRLALDLKAAYNEHPVAFSGQTGVIRDALAHKRFPLALSGTFSKATVAITGAIDDLLDLQGIALKAHVSGTDLAALGLDKEIPLPRTRAFDVTALLQGSREALALKDIDGNFSGSDLNLAFNGNVGDVLTYRRVDLYLKGSGTDLSRVGALIEEELPATDAFAFEGRLTGSGQSFSLEGAQGNARRGGLRLTVNGAVQDFLVLRGMDLQSRLTGKDLTEFGDMIGVKLPGTDEFMLQGRLTGSTGALALQAAKVSAGRGSLRLSLAGTVKDLLTLRGMDLQSSLTGKDLTEFGDMIGVKLPGTDEFMLQGRLTGSTGALDLQAARASAGRGSLRISLAGAVKDLLTLKGMDLQSSLTGKNLTEFGDMIGAKLPETDEFQVQGRLTGSTDRLALQAARASAGRGSLRISLAGAVKDLLTLKGLDLKTRLTGKELAELGPFVRAALPELGPFDVNAQLTGSANALAFNALSANIDKSDFKGLAKVTFHQKPGITLQLESSLVDFTSLLKSFEKDEPPPVNKEKQKQRLFSDDALPFDVLQTVNADIVLKAENIQAKNARLKFGHLVLKIVDGSFRIDKLEGTYKDTKFSGHGHIAHGTPTRVAAKFIVQDFDLGSFLKETGVSDEVRSHIDIAAELESRGDSVQSLVSHLDGSIGAVMGEGYLTRYLNMLSVNLSQKVLSFWNWARRHREKAEQIICAVVQFDIKEGVATSRAFVFNSQLAILTGEGEINLGSEQIDFLLVPNAKDPALLSLSTNLRVRGSLLEPQVRPDKRSLLTQGAWALSSLAVGPLGLLAPFVHLGAYKAHPCDVKGIGQIEGLGSGHAN